MTKPAPYDLQGRTEAHLIDYTPEIRKLALERAQKLDLLAPLFAPPTHRGNKEGKGPANICPAAVAAPTSPDRRRPIPSAGVIFIASTSGCSPTLLAPAAERDNDKMTGKTLAAWVTSRGEKPAPPAMANDPLAGIPDLFKGPVGRIIAIDMNTGEHLWMIPHGDTDAKVQEAFRNNPLLKGVQPRHELGPPRPSGACRVVDVAVCDRTDRGQPQQPVRDRQEDRQARWHGRRWRARAATG